MAPKKTPTPAESPRTELLVPIAKARAQIEARIGLGQQMLSKLTGPVRGLIGDAMAKLEAEREKWSEYNAELLRRLFSDGEQAKAYEWCAPSGDVHFTLDGRGGAPPPRTREVLEAELHFLDSLLERLELFPEPQGGRNSSPEGANAVEMHRTSPIDKIERLANRFHVVAQQLRSRHGGRETLKISDEYDVQDLLHALLRLEFDDVRPEEHTPSYAGGSSRMDFLLKNEQIVVEVKCTRDGLGAKEVGEQLLVDIAKYQRHEDCRALYCFVYDPAGRINNPSGLETDLSHARHGLPTRVRIRPKF
ncbi:MAG: hypothetical protein WA803_19805 [Steroidobacteraceae bacterium]